MGDHDIRDYIDRITRLDADNSGELVNNSSTEHAIPLVAKLFARGRSDICIFTGSFNPKIYATKDVIAALGVFLVGRSGKLRVAIQDSTEQVSDDMLSSKGSVVHSLVDSFSTDVLRSIDIRRAKSPASEIGVHFLAVDGSGFRFEPDNRKHEAVASFNRPDFATKLCGLFDTIFSSSTPVAMLR